MMEVQGFHHVAIQVHDVERVARFYCDVLGLTELARHTFDDGRLRSVWVSAKTKGQVTDGFLAIERAPDEQPRGTLGFSMVALRIAPDARAAIEAELTAHGVAIERRTGWTSYIRDPEGNLVGLSHHPHPAAPVL